MGSSKYTPRHGNTRRSGGATAVLRATVRRPVVGGALAVALLGSIGATVANGTSAHTLESAAAATPEESASEVAQTDLSTADTTRLAEDRRETNVSRSASREKVRLDGVERKKKAAKAKRAAEKAKPVSERKFTDAELKAIQKDPKPYAVDLMRERGWGDEQWGCLDSLWVGESDWTWSATNSSSGAYGIPQSLPASKMASAGDDWKTNPITQIQWGLDYIKDSYGSPCQALTFWQGKNPHWY